MMGFRPGMLGLMLFIWVGGSLKTQRNDEVLAQTRSLPTHAVRTSAKPTPRVSLLLASISRAAPYAALCLSLGPTAKTPFSAMPTCGAPAPTNLPTAKVLIRAVEQKVERVVSTAIRNGCLRMLLTA